MRSLLVRTGLRFEGEAENRFVRHFVAGDLRQTQAAMLLGSFVYYVFFFWDRIIDPVGAETTYLIRCGIVALVLLPATALLFVPSMRRQVEPVLLVYAGVPSVGLAITCAVLDRGFEFGGAGSLIVVLFVFTLLPMRTPYFAVFCAVLWGSFAALEALDANGPRGMAIVNAMCIGAAVTLGMYSAVTREVAARRAFLTTIALDASRRRVDDLLHSVLPREIVERIQAGETSIADAYGEVSIVIADLVGFTELSRRTKPRELVAILNRLFESFDADAERYGVEKIKTIGDAYLAVAGMSDADTDHPQRSARFALALQRSVGRIAGELGVPIRMRVGLHVGPVVAGVIGTKRPAFDCWGDTVNVASRLETVAEPGSVLISERAFHRLRGSFATTRVENVMLKGVGPATVFLLHDGGVQTDATCPGTS